MGEANNLASLNRDLGDEDFKEPLDAFEKIAKEGRKFWLNLVLATQQPRDITPGILSQMGTLVVHRLINEADRKVVEMACGWLRPKAAAMPKSAAPAEKVVVASPKPAKAPTPAKPIAPPANEDDDIPF